MLDFSLGVFYALLLTVANLVALPVVFASAALFRARRMVRRWSVPRVSDLPDLIRAVGADRRTAPHLRGLLALEQFRIGDEAGARAMMDRAVGDARHPLLRVKAWLDNAIFVDFEIKATEEADRRLKLRDLPDRVDPAAAERAGIAVWLRASDAVTAAVEKGDFERAVGLASAEPADAVGRQPALSLAFIAHHQHLHGDAAAASRTLILAADAAARLSNWWPIGDDSGYRESALHIVAQVQTWIDDADGAERTLARILDPDTADAAARDMAVFHAARGDLRETARHLWSIVDHDVRARSGVQVAQAWPTRA